MHSLCFASSLLAVQASAPLDSAEIARVLAQLKVSDSTVCELAGQALTNYGWMWRGGRDYSNVGMPMPRPMPTPMPMPGGGGGMGIMHDVMHGDKEHRSG